MSRPHPCVTVLGSGRGRAGAHPLATGCIVGYLLLLPVQFGASSLRLAPSDALILAYALLRLPSLRRVPAAWSAWHAALLAVFASGLLVQLLRTGGVTRYSLIEKLIGLLVLLLTYACLVDFIDSWQRLWLSLRALVFGVTLNAAGALLVFALQNAHVASVQSVNYGGVRLSGLLLDPNAFGGLVGLALLLLVFLTSTRPALVPRGWAGACVAVLSLALALTFSRSAWIAFVLALVGTALVHRRAVTRAWSGFVLPAAAAIVIFAVVYLPTLSALATRSGGSRVTILHDAFTDFQNSPVVGIGLGVFSERHGLIIHNTPVWFLTEFGAVGFLVLLGFITWYFRLGLRVIVVNTGRQRALGFALLAAQIAMIGLGLGIEAFYQRSWWFVLACTGSAYALSRERQVATHRPVAPVRSGRREQVAA